MLIRVPVGNWVRMASGYHTGLLVRISPVVALSFCMFSFILCSIPVAYSLFSCVREYVVSLLPVFMFVVDYSGSLQFFFYSVT